ncbi:MAG: hypothetical protein KF899_15885 [Parvibaculum sp.]|nr:hypothetical protein [Parvibaculum sp.]
MTKKVFTEEEIETGLLACADSLLADDPELQAAVEARMKADPAARAQVEGWTAINAAIRTAYAATAAEPVPPRLRAAFGPRPSRVPTRRAIYAATAMAAALAIAFVAGREVGMRMHMPQAPDAAILAAPAPSPMPSASNPAALASPAVSPPMPAAEISPQEKPHMAPYQTPAVAPGDPRGS